MASIPISNINSDLELAAEKEAHRDGMFAGVTSGLTGALIGARFMGFNRNWTIFCGCLTGVLSGYFFTRAFHESNLAQLKVKQSMTSKKDSTSSVENSGS